MFLYMYAPFLPNFSLSVLSPQVMFLYAGFYCIHNANEPKQVKYFEYVGILQCNHLEATSKYNFPSTCALATLETRKLGRVPFCRHRSSQLDHEVLHDVQYCHIKLKLAT